MNCADVVIKAVRPATTPLQQYDQQLNIFVSEPHRLDVMQSRGSLVHCEVAFQHENPIVDVQRWKSIYSFV